MERTDSIILNEDGSFKLRRKTNKPIIFKISTAENNFITIIAERTDINLSGDINALAETYTVSGSPSSELLADYLAHVINIKS